MEWRELRRLVQERSQGLDHVWRRARRWLKRYPRRWAPSACRYFLFREGRWVSGRSMLLIVGTAIATMTAWTPWLVFPVALWLALDLLLVNTAIVLGGVKGRSPLRSLLFTMIGYGNLALAFTPFWILIGCSEGSRWERGVEAFYQSVRTLATVGPEQSSLPPLHPLAKVVVSIELFTGIYFLVIIVAMYASWANQRGGR